MYPAVAATTVAAATAGTIQRWSGLTYGIRRDLIGCGGLGMTWESGV